MCGKSLANLNVIFECIRIQYDIMFVLRTLKYAHIELYIPFYPAIYCKYLLLKESDLIYKLHN